MRKKENLLASNKRNDNYVVNRVRERRREGERNMRNYWREKNKIMNSKTV